LADLPDLIDQGEDDSDSERFVSDAHDADA
jgi:hypothetical protein